MTSGGRWGIEALSSRTRDRTTAGRRGGDRIGDAPGAPGRAAARGRGGRRSPCSRPGLVAARRRAQWHALPVAGGHGRARGARPASRRASRPGASSTRRRGGGTGCGAKAPARRRRERAGDDGRPDGGGAAAPRARRSGGGSCAAAACRTTGWPSAILADRRAALLYRGLAALDEPTLAALAAEPDACGGSTSDHADVFAAFGARFRVRDGRGGGAGRRGGGAVVGGARGREPARRRRAFLRARCSRRTGDGGRSSTTRWPASTRAASASRSGWTRPAGQARGDGLPALAAVFDREAAWWRREGGAFARPDADAARVLREVRRRERRRARAPGGRAFWEAVFEEAGRRRAGRGLARGARVAAGRRPPGWRERVGAGDPASRRLRLEQLIFAPAGLRRGGRRARCRTSSSAVQGLRDARAARARARAHGRRATRPSSPRRRGRAPRGVGVAAGGRAPRPRGLQGALGVVDRARFARTLDLAAAERLVRSLCRAAGRRTRARAGRARGVGRGGAPARARRARSTARSRRASRRRPCCARWPATGSRGGTPSRRSTGRACGTGPIPAAREFARLERVRARQGGAGLPRGARACCALRRAEDARAVRAPRSGRRSSRSSTRRTSATPTGPALAGEDPSRRHDFGRRALGPARGGARARGRRGTCGARCSASSGRSRGSRSTASPATRCRTGRRCSTPRSGGGSRSPPALAQPARPDGRRPRRDRRGDRGAAGRARRPCARGTRTWRRRAARPASTRGGRARFEWLLEHEPDARGSFFSLGRAPAPRSARRAALGRVGRRRRSRRGPRPAHAAARSRWTRAAGRPPQPALAEALRGPAACAWPMHLAERRLPARLAPALVVDAPAGPLRRGPPRRARRPARPRRVGARAAAASGSTTRSRRSSGAGRCSRAPAPGGAR